MPDVGPDRRLARPKDRDQQPEIVQRERLIEPARNRSRIELARNRSRSESGSGAGARVRVVSRRLRAGSCDRGVETVEEGRCDPGRVHVVW